MNIESSFNFSKTLINNDWPEKNFLLVLMAMLEVYMHTEASIWPLNLFAYFRLIENKLEPIKPLCHVSLFLFLNV